LTETQSEDAVDISGVIEENTEPLIPIIHVLDVSDQHVEVQPYSNVIELPFELLKSLSEDSLLNNTFHRNNIYRTGLMHIISH